MARFRSRRSHASIDALPLALGCDPRVGLNVEGYLHGLEVAVLLAWNHFHALARLSVVPKRIDAVIGIAGAAGPAVRVAVDAGDFEGWQALALAGLGAVDGHEEQVFFLHRGHGVIFARQPGDEVHA